MHWKGTAGDTIGSAQRGEKKKGGEAIFLNGNFNYVLYCAVLTEYPRLPFELLLRQNFHCLRMGEKGNMIAG